MGVPHVMVQKLLCQHLPSMHTYNAISPLACHWIQDRHKDVAFTDEARMADASIAVKEHPRLLLHPQARWTPHNALWKHTLVAEVDWGSAWLHCWHPPTLFAADNAVPLVCLQIQWWVLSYCTIAKQKLWMPAWLLTGAVGYPLLSPLKCLG